MIMVPDLFPVGKGLYIDGSKTNLLKFLDVLLLDL